MLWTSSQLVLSFSFLHQFIIPFEQLYSSIEAVLSYETSAAITPQCPIWYVLRKEKTHTK
jgi:hypothetical protein